MDFGKFELFIAGLLLTLFLVSEYGAYNISRSMIEQPNAHIYGNKVVISQTIENANTIVKAKNFENVVHVGLGGGIAAPEVDVSLDQFNNIPKEEVYVYDNYAVTIKNGIIIKTDLGIAPNTIIKQNNGKYVVQQSYKIIWIFGKPFIREFFIGPIAIISIPFGVIIFVYIILSKNKKGTTSFY